jgi:hypothetical protein
MLFSTLKKMKNYSRITMEGNRLSGSMVISIEKEEADTLDTTKSSR